MCPSGGCRGTKRYLACILSSNLRWEKLGGGDKFLTYADEILCNGKFFKIHNAINDSLLKISLLCLL